jgi:RNA polymerase sigma factor (sigma-70 family)
VPRAGNIIRHLRQVVAEPERRTASDAELLGQFVRDGDQTAFELIVRRHERMVFGVCRRVLSDRQDAEDAFQATFLVLARKAASIRRREAVTGWLYQVACRIALAARAGAARRSQREVLHPGLDSVPAATEPASDAAWRELRPILDEELSRLPEKLRVPVVLCYLEGKSYAEAAALTGCPTGTLSGRLTRARALLARRLARRGVAASGVLLASALGEHARAAAARDAVLQATTEAAVRVAGGEAVARVVPAGVAGLVEGGMRAMFMTHVKFGAGVLAAVFVCAGAAGLTYRALASVPRQQEQRQVGSQVATSAPDQPKGTERTGAKATAPDRARAVLRDARKAADAIQDAQWRAWVLQSIAEEQARTGDRAAAAQTFQEAIETAKLIRSEGFDPTSQSRETLVWIAGSQAAAGDARGARETAEAIEGPSRERALWAVAHGLVRFGDIEGALKTVRDDSVLGAVVRRQAETGKLTEAARTLEAIGSDEVRVGALAALASAQVRASDKPAARKTYARALKIAARIGQHAYVEIARAQAETGDLQAARETADDIIIEPWRSTALLAIQIKAGDFKDALQTALNLTPHFKRGEAFHEVVTAQVRSGDIEGALRAADTVKHVYWRVATLAEIAKAQARAGDRAAAAGTFRRALALLGDVRDQEETSGNLRNAAACCIVRAQAEAGEENGAVAWVMKQDPLRKAQGLISIAQGIAARQE